MAITFNPFTGTFDFIGTSGGGGGGTVSSFNGRTGAISPISADYDTFYYTKTLSDASYIKLDGSSSATTGSLSMGNNFGLKWGGAFGDPTITGNQSTGNISIDSKNYVQISSKANTNEVLRIVNFNGWRVNLFSPIVGANININLPTAPGTLALITDIYSTQFGSYTAGAGVISATDTTLTAIQKLDGNTKGFNQYEFLTANASGYITSSGYSIEDFFVNIGRTGKINLTKIAVLNFGTADYLDAIYSDVANNLNIAQGFSTASMNAPLVARNITPDTTSRNLGGTSGGIAWNNVYAQTFSSNNVSTVMSIRHLGSSNMAVFTGDYTSTAAVSTQSILINTGNITNASASGNTGSILFNVGTNAGSGARGNYYWGTLTTQSNLGRGNFFWGDTTLAPTGNPSAGMYGWVASAGLNLRNINGIINTIGIDITAGGNFIAGTLSKGFQIKEGSNARMGTATLVSGTVTIANTTITNNTRIFLTASEVGVITNPIRVTGRSVGTNFTVGTGNPTDTVTFVWELKEGI